MAAEGDSRFAEVRARIARLREWLEQTLLWRVWERMLEVEFVDRSVALAVQAFVFFPLAIVLAAFMPERIRESIIATATSRLGMSGDALETARQAFASSEEIRTATGVLGLILTIFFATSFTTALQRAYLQAWRRPAKAGASAYWRGATWLAAVLVYAAVLGGLQGALHGVAGVSLFILVSFAASAGLWWFTSWLLLLGDVRARVLLPSGVITGTMLMAFAMSATLWMPEVATENERQFGLFGVALALVTWTSGAVVCVLVGACAGPVLADDRGRIGTLVRGGGASMLNPGATPSLPTPARELSLRDAFRSTDDT